MELQVVIPTISGPYRGFRQSRRELIPQASIKQSSQVESRFRVAVSKDLLFGLLQKLLGSPRPWRRETSRESARMEERTLRHLAQHVNGLFRLPFLQHKVYLDIV